MLPLESRGARRHEYKLVAANWRMFSLQENLHSVSARSAMVEYLTDSAQRARVREADPAVLECDKIERGQNFGVIEGEFPNAYASPIWSRANQRAEALASA